jgi:protein-S-isoprenylcysteine O-methyltransferase Ste14
MLATFKLIALLVITIVILMVSRAALRRPGSHGFYRFFAWEAIVALVLLNLDDWLAEPFSPGQLFSWLLLAISLFLVIIGARTLQREGAPDSGREDPSLLGPEKTTALITTGVYRYIRHPLYSSLLFLAWGAFLKGPTWAAGGLAAAATVFLVATARVEEAENIEYFGPAYREYMDGTKMFIPFLF